MKNNENLAHFEVKTCQNRVWIASLKFYLETTMACLELRIGNNSTIFDIFMSELRFECAFTLKV